VELERKLVEIGLSDKEARVYLVLLSLGTARAAAIARNAGILRETAYAVLNQLIAKGLVSTVVKGGITYYEATDPSVIAERLLERYQKFRESLPELNKLKRTISEKPQVQLYEGKEGLKSILDDIIASKKELRTLGSAKVFDELRFYFPKFIQRRIEAKIRVRVLQERVPIIEEMMKRNRRELRRMRFLPKWFRINSMIHIYGDKFAWMVFGRQQLGIIIQNEEIANTMCEIFDVLWELSEKS